MERPPENSYTELYKKATERVNARVAARQQQRGSLQLPDTTPNVGDTPMEVKFSTQSDDFENVPQSPKCTSPSTPTATADGSFSTPFRFGYPSGGFTAFPFDAVDTSDMTLSLPAVEALPYATAEPNKVAFTINSDVHPFAMAESNVHPFTTTESNVHPFTTTESNVQPFSMTEPNIAFSTDEEANLQQMDTMLLSGVRIVLERKL